MKAFFIFLGLTLSLSTYSQSIHQFKALDIKGDTIDFSKFKGKKMLIVNTASKCGLTPQYEELEKLYQTYKDSNFVIIGFPANNFMEQEPANNKEIAEFCLKNYGVSFIMMSKISVKGEEQHQIYQFLTQKSLNGVEDSEVKWNFHKYLLNEKGELVKNLSPKTKPLDPQITSWILAK